MSARKALAIAAVIAVACLTIEATARLAAPFAHVPQLQSPWLGAIQLSAQIVQVIAWFGVLVLLPYKPWGWRWRHALTPASVTPVVVYLGVVAAAMIWPQASPSAASALVQAIARNADLWGALIVWEIWCLADQWRVFNEQNRAEPSQSDGAIC